MVVQFDQVVQPSGAGSGTDEHEQGPCLDDVPRPGPVVDGDGFQDLIAEQFPHLGAAPMADPRSCGAYPTMTGGRRPAHHQAG